MYDRVVDVPRLVASLPDDGPGHPLLERMREILSAHYETAFARVSMGYYRNGADSVAWHGDYVAREMEEPTVVATRVAGRAPAVPAAAARRRPVDRVQPGARRPVRDGRGLPAHLAARHPQGRARPPRLAVMFRPIWDQS